MSTKQPVSLIGRLAIQCKMITMEQLQVATREQGRDPERRLGDIFVELGFVDEGQIQKLKKLQRDLVVKHRAKQAASGRTVPERAASQAHPPAATVPAAPRQPERPLQSEAPNPPAPVAEPSPPAAGVRDSQPVSREDSTETQERDQSAPKTPAAPTETDQNDEESLDLAITDSNQADLDALNTILRDAVGHGASDIHLHSGAPTKVRINGALQEVSGSVSDPAMTARMVSATLTPTQQAELNSFGELDLCYDVAGVGRFRTNIYAQQRGFDAVYRAIPADPRRSINSACPARWPSTRTITRGWS
jgi:type II secretory ATPase GspE/PulE/Tfp pilus assembly ATPase PilB-like protein